MQNPEDYAWLHHFLHIKCVNYIPLIGKLHNAMSLNKGNNEGIKNIMDIGLWHKCCDQKTIRMKDIFFWNEQYLHDNVGCCE